MSKTVKPEELGAEIAKALGSYSSDVNVKLKEIAKECADRLTDDVRKSSQRFKGTGKYAKGWSVKKTFESSDQIAYTTYNKTDYQLTHLLEYGHEKWLWGKKTGDRVPAYPHIRPNADRWIKEFENQCKQVIQKIK